MGVALVMLLSPLGASAAVPGVNFKASQSVISWTNDNSGCATAKMSTPTWTPLAATAHWDSTSNAKSCGTSFAGVGTASSASTATTIEVAVPVKMPNGAGGVNVSWLLSAAWAIKAKIGPVGTCPGSSYNYSYYYSYYNSYVNYSDSYSYCSVSAYLSLGGSAWLVDEKTNAYSYPTNYWAGVNKRYDTYNDTSVTTETWSNSSDWGNNYTSWSTSGYRSGATGAGTIGASQSPTWYINGTFTSTDKYVLYVEIVGSTSADVSGMNKSLAVATLNFGTTGLGALLQATVW